MLIGQESCHQESCQSKEIRDRLKTCKRRKDVVLLTGIGEKAKNFQLLVILEQAKGLKQGGEGFTGILEI